MPTRRPSTHSRRAVIVVAAAACLLFFTATVSGAGGQQFSLPLGAKNPSGLTLRIDARGIDANGYRPIVIDVGPKSGKPLTADRQLRVVLEISRAGSDSKAQISQIVELPEGSTTVKATILVPHSSAWTNFRIDTFEGGEKHLDLSEKYLRWANSNGLSWTEALPALLVIDSRVPSPDQRVPLFQAMQSTGVDPAPTYTLPDIRPLLALFADFSSPGQNLAMPRGVRSPPAAPPIADLSTAARISDTTLLSLVARLSRKEMAAPAELPSRWIAWSQYDVVAISLADLQLIAKSHRPQLTALRDWLSTGTVLVVSGIGDQYEHLPELDKLLGLPPLPGVADADPFRFWNAPDAKLDTGELRAPLEVIGPNHVRDADADLSVNSSASNASKIKSSPFAFRSAMLGCVVAIGSDKPLGGTQRDWAWIFNSVPQKNWKWLRRTGFSLARTNNDYWKFLIPGVGRAPVVSFLVLVSLFALIIGPVNYWLLGRARRLYLLLLTVPAGAALVTFALFVFALFSDGFSTRLRARSFTDLDQRTGRAALWSRQSYYAGIAPSQGLAFPEDTAVFPILHEPGVLGRNRTTLLVWDGGQQLKNGFLASRTATQFMVCRATTSQARLIVAEGAAGQPPKVENRLATRIPYLLLRDSRGDYFEGQSLPEKTVQNLIDVEPHAAAAILQKLAAATQPAYPYDGYDPELQNDNLFMDLGFRRSRMAHSDSGAGDSSMAWSLLETNIRRSIDPAANPLDPGTYIAIVEESPLVVTGVPRAHQEASFHVIRGRY